LLDSANHSLDGKKLSLFHTFAQVQRRFLNFEFRINVCKHLSDRNRGASIIIRKGSEIDKTMLSDRNIDDT